MKATKKIVGAACALVAAVALSAGSTFAWFASSNKVTATGMMVQATVPLSLYIEEGYKTDLADVTKNTINFGDTTVTELTPAALSTDTGKKLKEITDSGSSATATVNDFAKDAVGTALNVLTAPSFTEAADSWEKVPDSGYAGVVKENGYVQTDSFTFASTGAASDTTKSDAYKEFIYKQDMTLANKSMDINVTANVSITFTKDTTDTYKFLRVGFVVGTPGEDSTTYAFTSLKNDATVAVDGTTATLSFKYENLIEDFGKNTLRTVTFFVWFDGDDTDCYVDNATDVSAFTIAIEYEAKEVVAGSESGEETP